MCEPVAQLVTVPDVDRETVGVTDIDADAQNEPECDGVTLADAVEHTVYVSVGDIEKDVDTVNVSDDTAPADFVAFSDGVEVDDLQSVCVGDIVGDCDGLPDALVHVVVVGLSDTDAEVVAQMVGEFVQSSTVGVTLPEVVGDAIGDAEIENVVEEVLLVHLD